MIERPFSIEDDQHGRRLVRRAVATESELADAIFDIEAGSDADFSIEAWQTVLDRLDACQLTVAEWLNQKRPTE